MIKTPKSTICRGLFSFHSCPQRASQILEQHRTISALHSSGDTADQLRWTCSAVQGRRRQGKTPSDRGRNLGRNQALWGWWPILLWAVGPPAVLVQAASSSSVCVRGPSLSTSMFTTCRLMTQREEPDLPLVFLSHWSWSHIISFCCPTFFKVFYIWQHRQKSH